MSLNQMNNNCVIPIDSTVIFKLSKRSKERIGKVKDITYLNDGLRYAIYVKVDGWILDEDFNRVWANNFWAFKMWLKSERIIKVLK